MITAAWLIFKSFIGKVIDLFTRYPLQFILVLVCCYAFWQKTRYDAIAYDFEAYKSSVQLQADMQKAKNEILRKQSETALNDATAIYENNLKAIKNEYLKKQKLDSVTISDLRSRLRDQIRTDSFRVPEAPADTASAEEWRNSHAAAIRQYETLVLACQITTNDYNLLRGWADIACTQVGCE